MAICLRKTSDGIMFVVDDNMFDVDGNMFEEDGNMYEVDIRWQYVCGR